MENLAVRDNSVSGERGVTWYAKRSQWHGQIGHAGKVIHVGYYNDLSTAITAVRAKRAELYTHNVEA